MKNKIKYTDEPMGELRIVKDFLPPPDQLVFKGRKRENNHRVKKIERGIFQKRSTEASYFLPKND